jgi:hypothetical protein
LPSFIKLFGNRGIELEAIATLAYHVFVDYDKVTYLPQTIVDDTALKQAAKKVVDIAKEHGILIGDGGISWLRHQTLARLS